MKIILTVIVVIISAGVIICYVGHREICHCIFINTSDNFSEVVTGLYISKDTPGNIKDSVISILLKADKRVRNFWNVTKRTGSPVIIFCSNDSLLEKYAAGSRILTYKTLLNSYIVFGKEAVDPDILSHELFHTEFCARTGYFNNARVPVWFDEGLAMQVDYRKEYSDSAYNFLLKSGQYISPVESISTPGSFYSGKYYEHFIIAKHEVSAWLAAAGKKGFWEFIRGLEKGKDFNRMYSTVKFRN